MWSFDVLHADSIILFLMCTVMAVSVVVIGFLIYTIKTNKCDNCNDKGNSYFTTSHHYLASAYHMSLVLYHCDSKLVNPYLFLIYSFYFILAAVFLQENVAKRIFKVRSI